MKKMSKLNTLYHLKSGNAPQGSLSQHFSPPQVKQLCSVALLITSQLLFSQIMHIAFSILIFDLSYLLFLEIF